MNTIKRRLVDDFRAMARDRRGSALLVSLMVMVGLSLLGLSFVAISETETAIASHERDSSQALDAAESGAKMVVEWFQDPSWAKTNNFLPSNNPALKTARTIAGGNPGTDYYKGLSTADLLFDTPYTVQNGRFFGDEAHADVVINYSNATGLAFLNSLNALMFTTDANVGSGATAAIEGGGVRITEIRVYAPPVIGGTFDTTTGFWGTAGARYGLATIKVTASKFGPTEVKKTDLSQATPLATRFVKIVVNQWPFPGPQGPIQSNANIQTGGNFGVHWGRMTAQGDMDIKIPLVGLNWFDAWDHPHFEHGYDSSDPWQPSHAYAVDEVVHPSTGPNGNSYICTAAGTSGAAGAEPAWSTYVAPNTIAEAGTLRWQVRGYPALYPNIVGASSPTQIDQYNWLYELINKTYEDPWFEARARGDITNATSLGNTSIQPYPYQDWTLDETNAPSAGYSNWFQKQTTTIPKSSQMKQVIFPRIDYDFWKDIAVTGAGTQNVFYLQWVSADQFTDGITTKSFAKWVNTVTGATPGYYFFDTQNKQNPQGAGAPGTLTPAISVNSADDGHILQMAGFIYLNAAEFGTTGIGGPDGYQNYPGEPYRDVGYQLVSKTTGGTPAQTRGSIFIGTGGTLAPYDGANNSTRDWEDLAWSNSGTAGKPSDSFATIENGEFDVYMRQRQIRLADGTLTTEWFPVPWYPGCHPGTNAHLDIPGTPDPLGCSEPGEPYLNLKYYNGGNISKAKSGGGARSVSTGWEDPATQTRMAKKTTTGKVPVTCSATSSVDDCTSNAWDKDGPLVDDIQPILNGVFYLEGDFDATGNAPFYGSLLINGNVGKTGTPEVWFDEKLVKDEWPPKEMNFPRVYTSAHQTDR